MTAGLVMAGGRSERMRRSGNSCHKALRQVRGVSLLERNIRYLLEAGIDRIFVSTNQTEHAVVSFIQREATKLVSSVGGSISCLIEHEPLGTIGIAHRLTHEEGPIVVLNVDNLTAIDLTQMISTLEASDAAICIATHLEEFQVPLGQVVCCDGEILEYREKPKLPVRISSGAYVLTSRVCNWISAGRRTDIPELIPMAHARGERVVAHEHDAPWIDINDSETLLRAERLVDQHMTKIGRPR